MNDQEEGQQQKEPQWLEAIGYCHPVKSQASSLTKIPGDGEVVIGIIVKQVDERFSRGGEEAEQVEQHEQE